MMADKLSEGSDTEADFLFGAFGLKRVIDGDRLTVSDSSGVNGLPAGLLRLFCRLIGPARLMKRLFLRWEPELGLNEAPLLGTYKKEKKTFRHELCKTVCVHVV